MKQDFDFMDELARKALENFEVPFDGDDWSLMEQQLDQGEPAIDKQARQELANLEVPFNAQHWALLEQKLQAGEHLIDKVAQESLSNLDIPFNPEHWGLLEAKLDRREKRPKFWLFKTVELTVVGLSLLFCFALPQKPVLPTSVGEEGQSEKGTTLNKKARETVANTVETNEAFAHLQSALAQQQQGLNAATQKAGSVSLLPKTATSAFGGKSFQHQQAQQQQYALYGGLKSGKNFDLSGISGGFNTPISTQQTAMQLPADQQTNTLLLTTEQDAQTPSLSDLSTEERRHIAELTLPVITRSTDEVEDPLFELKPIKSSTNYKQRLRLGLLLGADANMDSGYGNSHLGYTGGWLLEAEFSYFVALQTGMQVAQKNYHTRGTYEVMSPFGEQKIYTIEEERVTRLTHLQLPLQVQVAFFRNKHWRIGASAGAMFNFIVAQSQVGTQKLYQQGMMLYNELNPNDFQRGWWQGASLRDNFYLTLGGGLLVERQLTDDWSLFVQPQYYHSLTQKIGRAGFKVGVFSMNVGVKKSF